VFGSGNQVKGAAGFSAGAGNRVCDTYGVALGNNAKSGGPLINGKCDPDTFRNTANNEFAARATGGFRFRTNLGGTTGCNLPAGSGVFNCTSSRTTKENFFDVNGDDVLARLRKVPV